ncbi:hypothetical protein LOAG_14834, partial [Loa loa]
ARLVNVETYGSKAAVPASAEVLEHHLQDFDDEKSPIIIKALASSVPLQEIWTATVISKYPQSASQAKNSHLVIQRFIALVIMMIAAASALCMLYPYDTY